MTRIREGHAVQFSNTIIQYSTPNTFKKISIRKSIAFSLQIINVNTYKVRVRKHTVNIFFIKNMSILILRKERAPILALTDIYIFCATRRYFSFAQAHLGRFERHFVFTWLTSTAFKVVFPPCFCYNRKFNHVICSSRLPTSNFTTSRLLTDLLRLYTTDLLHGDLMR